MKLLYVEARDVNPHQNIAIEKYLFDHYGHNHIILYLWQNDKTVVIGRHQNPWAECNLAAIKESKGYIARRYSGGGAVYHDKGNLNFTFILPKAHYDLERQLSVILSSLQNLGIDALFTGRNDITYRGKKFSGNAFFHSQNTSCHHGTLLVGSNMSDLSRYLNANKLKLKAHGVKSVKSRVTNLKDIRPDISIDQIIKAIKRNFSAEYQGPLTALSVDDIVSQDSFTDLYMKLSSNDWILGKTPRFEVSHDYKYRWGHLQFAANIKNGIIEDMQIFSDAIDVDYITALNTILHGTQFDYDTIIKNMSKIDTEHEYLDDLKEFFNQVFMMKRH